MGPGRDHDERAAVDSDMDTNFERVRRAMLRQGEGDRVPLFEISIHPDIKAAILGRPITSPQDEVDFWRVAGYDFVSIRAGVRSVVRGFHPVVEEWRRLRQDDVDLQKSTGWAVKEAGIIQDRKDLETFPWPHAEAFGGYKDYAEMAPYLEALSACLPPNMKLLVQLGYLFMGAWQLMGFEHFCIQLKRDPQLVKDVIDRLAQSQMEVLEILLQYDTVGTVWMPDDLCYNSGPMVSPKVYRALVFPHYRELVERCHRANVPVGLHSDGDLKLLLPDLIDCGFDAIHPFEPPMNDIVGVKRRWGDRIAVAGNIDLKSALCEGRPQDVKAEVRAKAAALAPGGGWLLGSSNSIPDFVPLENYRALLAASLYYGKFEVAHRLAADEVGGRATIDRA
jgi:uroporphyrinogen decarboxylase